MGKVIRATFIDVKADAADKIMKLAEEICVSNEHNLIIEDMIAYVIPPKQPTPAQVEAETEGT